MIHGWLKGGHSMMKRELRLPSFMATRGHYREDFFWDGSDQEVVMKMTNNLMGQKFVRGGVEFVVHIRRSWHSREIPEADLIIQDYEWKIYSPELNNELRQEREDKDPERLWQYYVLTLDPDKQLLFVEHSTTDGGLPPPYGAPRDFEILTIHDDLPDVNSFVQEVLDNHPPCHFGLT